MRFVSRPVAFALLGCAWLVPAACGGDSSEPGGSPRGGTAGSAGDAGMRAGRGGSAGVEQPPGEAGGANAGEAGAAGDAGNGSGGTGGDGGRGGDDSGGEGGAGGEGAGPFCGDAEIEAEEECERRSGCDADERCSATCSCESAPAITLSSQELIELAYRAGDIDRATALQYRVWALFQAPELPRAYEGSGSQGEDTYLFLELSRARRSLPSAVEAAIAPYLVRPNQATSIFSQPPPATAAEPAPVGCPPNDGGQPDWRAHETTNFVIWSCGGGVGGIDPLANARVVTGTVAEEALSAMSPKLGSVRDDDDAASPGEAGRTDIYLVSPNRCRMRGETCEPVPGTPLAAAVPATPCLRVNGGPSVSSAYLLLDGQQIPSTAPAPGAASPLHASLTHELFHAISFGLNLEAQGGVCDGDADDGATMPEEVRSWLTEASAEWASFAFFPAAAPARRSQLFRDYQLMRDSSRQGLHETLGLLPQQAFLYPLFVTEELEAGADGVFDFWKRTEGARSPAELDALLNATLPFSIHFRDFTTRNFNRELPGSPIVPLHEVFDPALRADEPAAYVPGPHPELPAPIEISQPLHVPPLSAETLHYSLDRRVRWFRSDTSGLSNLGRVRIDAILKVGDEWRRERVDGPVFEYCHDDAHNDISEMYLIISNFDTDPSAEARGDVRVSTRANCPGGWSGIMRVRRLVEERTQTQSETAAVVTSRREVESHEWAVIESAPHTPRSPANAPEVERASVLFRGEATETRHSISTSSTCTDTSLEVSRGSGAYRTFFDFASPSARTYTWTPTEEGEGFTMHTETSVGTCGAFSRTSSTEPRAELFSYLTMVPELVTLTESTSAPGHLNGRVNVVHEETPVSGGVTVVDVIVEWDLRRTQAR